MAEAPAIDQHLFRRESGRIVAALTRIFGVHNLQLSQDVAQDAMCRALEVWKVRGVPEHPGAWLMATAKNRALDMLRHERRVESFAPELGRLIDSEWTLVPLLDEAFEASSIRDEQLRMMLSCCHPQLAEEAQLALILNVLCGFSAHEIGSALLTSPAAIEKRISRGKQTLAGKKTLFDLRDADFPARLDTLRRALYLLFNEGYHGASYEAVVRAELCHEAIRLTGLLCEYPPAATPETHALAALMCLNAARLPTRLDEAGELRNLEDQERSRWDAGLIDAGITLLERSANGDSVSAYHVEAAIAAAHAGAATLAETDWRLIVSLYDRLLRLTPSPVVAMNRAIAIAERDGAEPGLQALHSIVDRERLAAYPFYPAALGKLELRRGDFSAAARHFEAALLLARNDAERRFLDKCLAESRSGREMGPA